MSVTEAWADARGWREFLDLLADAVVVLDSRARVVLANTAALRLLPCEAGMPVEQFQATLGLAAVRWLKRMALGRVDPGTPPALRLPDGRAATLTWRRLDAQHVAMNLSAPAAPVTGEGPVTMPAGGMRDTIDFLWASPFPALLQGADFRIVDVNAAFVEFSGHARESVIGLDPVEFQHPDDRPAMLADREPLRRDPQRETEATMVSGRIIDASGRERRYRAARRTLLDANGTLRYLGVLQDMTDEHIAREHADRSLRELDDWFDLSPVGMVLSDDRGLLVRTNPAFDALVGALPVSLGDAPEGLRELLGWSAAVGDAAAQPDPDAAPVQREAWVARAGEAPRLLRAVVRGYRGAGGQRRTMAVIEDRSAEEERDLAQVQIGALMDTAGVALATFQESSGWVRLGRTNPSSNPEDSAADALLHTINREIVATESLPEFERLQTALRRAEHAEVRYAIQHPQLGERWLLTRVEPATLASGKRTTSLVTLDVTEQHRAQLRTEQLLHELSTILESTNAGIAYLRGDVLVRCNRRFEAMLGQAPGAITGRTLHALLGAHEQTGRIATDAWQSLSEGVLYETEFNFLLEEDGRNSTRWYSLSVRRAGALDGPLDGPLEAIAALVDVTRLKAQQREFEILARDRELMFSLSGVGIAFLRAGRIQNANRALAQLTGYSVAELAALPLAELFVDAAEFEKRWPQVEHSLFEHGRWSGERQLRGRDGRAIWVQVSKQLVVAEDVHGGIIAAYVNVDARVRAERAVALQAGRNRAILDSALVGIVTVGPLGIEWMNRSARRMFGAELPEMANKPIATVATDDPDHPFLRTQYLTELVEGEAETFECQVKALDGRQFWVVGNVVSTAREPGGRQLTYALLDIERRRDAEARVSQAQAQLQRIIEAAPLAITLRDAATLRVVQINAAAAANVGATPAELIGLSPEEIFEPLLAIELRRDMTLALASDAVTQCEYRTEQDGELRVWDARYLPLTTAPDQPPDQLLLVATDVTEQRAAQEARFEAALAQRDMLVKEVHHRIKNNLQGVAGLLQQIGQRKPEVAGPIAEVVGQVQAIAQVYGLQVGASGPLQLLEVVRAITASVQRTFGRTIAFDASGEAPSRWMLPEAEAIPIALTLNELLTNALKHSGAASEVRCGLVGDAAGIKVQIENAGALPTGFGLARIPGGVSGLGLVRALLPRRHAQLTIEQHGPRVCATVALQAPVVERVDQA